MSIIVDDIMKNERLKRLLFHTSNDALTQRNLTREETISLFNKNIKNTPKIKVDKDVLNYLFINFDNFSQSYNPEFRDNLIEFDIICHFDQWHLKDFALRPFKIAAELDSMFHNRRMTGIGRLEFAGATQGILTDEFGYLCLLYRAVHGGEDKKIMPNPQDEEQFLKDFKDYTEDTCQTTDQL